MPILITVTKFKGGSENGIQLLPKDITVETVFIRVQITRAGYSVRCSGTRIVGGIDMVVKCQHDQSRVWICHSY